MEKCWLCDELLNENGICVCGVKSSNPSTKSNNSSSKYEKMLADSERRAQKEAEDNLSKYFDENFNRIPSDIKKKPLPVVPGMMSIGQIEIPEFLKEKMRQIKRKKDLMSKSFAN